MKRSDLTKVVVLGLMLVCSTGIKAQVNLGNILSGITGSGSSSATSDVMSELSSIFSSDKQASASKIVGTWTYSEPAIVFQSDNVLTKAGASLAAGKIETKLQTYLTRYGFKPGAFTITFDSDGTFTEVFGTKTIKGKWAVKDSKLNMTYATKTIAVTTQVSGSKLMFVTDATKLLSLMKTLGSKSTNTSIQTVTTLMKSVNGMQAGVTLVKK